MTPPELLDFPYKGTKEQFDAFAEAVGQLYLASGRARIASNGTLSVPFRRAAMRRIRYRTPSDFETAMKWAVKDVGRAEQLLALKTLIFG